MSKRPQAPRAQGRRGRRSSRSTAGPQADGRRRATIEDHLAGFARCEPETQDEVELERARRLASLRLEVFRRVATTELATRTVPSRPDKEWVFEWLAPVEAALRDPLAYSRRLGGVLKQAHGMTIGSALAEGLQSWSSLQQARLVTPEGREQMQLHVDLVGDTLVWSILKAGVSVATEAATRQRRQDQLVPEGRVGRLRKGRRRGDAVEYAQCLASFIFEANKLCDADLRGHADVYRPELWQLLQWYAEQENDWKKEIDRRSLFASCYRLRDGGCVPVVRRMIERPYAVLRRYYEGDGKLMYPRELLNVLATFATICAGDVIGEVKAATVKGILEHVREDERL